MTNAEVIGVESGTGPSLGYQTVNLADGSSLKADVVIGADGTFLLWQTQARERG